MSQTSPQAESNLVQVGEEECDQLPSITDDAVTHAHPAGKPLDYICKRQNPLMLLSESNPAEKTFCGKSLDL